MPSAGHRPGALPTRARAARTKVNSSQCRRRQLRCTRVSRIASDPCASSAGWSAAATRRCAAERRSPGPRARTPRSASTRRAPVADAGGRQGQLGHRADPGRQSDHRQRPAAGGALPASQEARRGVGAGRHVRAESTMAPTAGARLLGGFHDNSFADDRFRLSAFAGSGQVQPEVLRHEREARSSPTNPLGYRWSGALGQVRGAVRDSRAPRTGSPG